MVGYSWCINDATVNTVWPPPRRCWHKTQARVYATILLHNVFAIGEGVKGGGASLLGFPVYDRGK